MQGIPVPVTDVTVWPHYDWPAHGGRGPVVLPVIENASGTYTVSTLVTDVFYNLELDPTKPSEPLHAGGMYTASFTANGKQLSTPWMYCTSADEAAEFGRTVHVVGSPSEASASVQEGVDGQHLLDLAPLKDITVSQPFKPPAVGSRLILEAERGELVATTIGAPHLMGIAIDTDGVNPSRLQLGMGGLLVTAANATTGKLESMANLTCRQVGGTAILLQSFP